MLKRLVRHPAGQAVLAAVLGRYLAFALGTTRWTLDGGQHLEALLSGQPVVFAAWHERLPLMPALWLHVRKASPALRVRILISRSRDGRFVAAIVSRFGIRSWHGSTSRGGASGIRALLDVIAAGESVGITPDGPRGPRRVLQPGVAQLAALSGAPVIPCAAQTSRRVELRSWDRMVLPRPFGRGTIVCSAPMFVAREGWRKSLPALGAALNDAADRADRLCGLER